MIDQPKSLGIMIADSLTKSTIVDRIRFMIYELNIPFVINNLNYELSHNVNEDFLIIIADDSFEVDALNNLTKPTLVVSDYISSKYNLKDNIKVSNNDIVDILMHLIIFLKQNNCFNSDLIIAIYILFELFTNEEFNFNALEYNDGCMEDNYSFISELFIAGNKGFSQENSISMVNNTKICFNLEPYHFLEINKLRFDPDHMSCVLRNIKFSIEYSDGEIVPLMNFTTNACLNKYDKYFFETNDPQIEFHFRKINPKYFYCSFDMEHYHSSAKVNPSKWFYEVRDFYRKNKEVFLKLYQRNIFNLSESEDNLLCSKLKPIYVYLGPRSTSIDMVNNFLLNNMLMLIQNKTLYPTHQKSDGYLLPHGGLYTVFTKPFIGDLYFDHHKVRNLLANLNSSSFNRLLISSANFLENDRMRYFYASMPSAKYIFYLRNFIESCFEEYKFAVLYQNEKRKFYEIYLFIANKYCLELFNLLKYIPKSQIIFRNTIDSFDNHELICLDLMSIVGVDIFKLDGYVVDTKQDKIAHKALEFKRLINYYPISSILVFLNNALKKFNDDGGYSYTYLSKEQQDDCLSILYNKLYPLLYSLGYDNLVDLLSKEFDCDQIFIVTQELSKVDIINILTFLDLYSFAETTELLEIINRSPNNLTNNNDFMIAVEQYMIIRGN